MTLTTPIFRLKRRAKLLARDSGAPLHTALDQVARKEGYRSWSHLAAITPGLRPAPAMLARLAPGDLLLLAARPGHGKTLLGLELAVEAARAGKRAFFFTLEDSEATVLDRLRHLGAEPAALAGALTIDASDTICADHVIRRVDRAALVVIDYLQLLDQRRSNPELDTQIAALRSFATTTGSIVVALSQIDRAFDVAGKRRPDTTDIRRPNPFDLQQFTKACFLHNGEARLETLA